MKEYKKKKNHKQKHQPQMLSTSILSLQPPVSKILPNHKKRMGCFSGVGFWILFFFDGVVGLWKVFGVVYLWFLFLWFFCGLGGGSGGLVLWVRGFFFCCCFSLIFCGVVFFWGGFVGVLGVFVVGSYFFFFFFCFTGFVLWGLGLGGVFLAWVFWVCFFLGGGGGVFGCVFCWGVGFFCLGPSPFLSPQSAIRHSLLDKKCPIAPIQVITDVAPYPPLSTCL